MATTPGLDIDTHRPPTDGSQDTSLSVEMYGNPATYAQELATMFHPGRSALFMSHEALLPEAGHVQAEADDRVLLTRSEDGEVRAFANVCTHALRPLATSRDASNQSCVTCPFHQWSFRRDGSLIGGRDITFSDSDRERLALDPFPLRTWHGSHFCGAGALGESFSRDLALMEAAFVERGLGDWLDFGDWTLVGTADDAYYGDWKTFMDVYGDCYHVPPYHPGLASFADCDTLEWVFGESAHVQFVKLSAEAGGRSDAYARWVSGMAEYYAARGEPASDMAVVWTAFYPNVMIEYYNGLRVLSILVPTGPESYRNRVRYFVPPDLEQLVPGVADAIMAAYEETAVQDKVLNESRHEGLVMARELGLDRTTYYANLCGPAPELGTVHFHRWWRAAMGKAAVRGEDPQPGGR